MSATVEGKACISRVTAFLQEKENKRIIDYVDKNGCGKMSFNDRINVLDQFIYQGQDSVASILCNEGGHFIKGHINQREIARYKCCNSGKPGIQCPGDIRIGKQGTLTINSHNQICLNCDNNSETSQFIAWCKGVNTGIWENAMYHVGSFQKVSHGNLTQDHCFRIFALWLKGKHIYQYINKHQLMYFVHCIHLMYGVHCVRCTYISTTNTTTTTPTLNITIQTQFNYYYNRLAQHYCTYEVPK